MTGSIHINVLLAGKPRLVAKLHRPRPGGVRPPRGPTPVSSEGAPRLRRRPSRRQAVTMWTRPADRAPSYGACGQALEKLTLPHHLSTLAALAPSQDATSTPYLSSSGRCPRKRRREPRSTLGSRRERSRGLWVPPSARVTWMFPESSRLDSQAGWRRDSMVRLEHAHPILCGLVADLGGKISALCARAPGNLSAAGARHAARTRVRRASGDNKTPIASDIRSIVGSLRWNTLSRIREPIHPLR